jgi:glycosyltransferase involved in cell wall biosynthesis
MIPLNDLRIGYIPYSKKFDSPGDRRRFCYYAKKRDIEIEIAIPSERYDLVVLTERCDLSVWSKYHKGNAKLIYELIDPYLAISRRDPKGLLRGLAKYVTGQSQFLQLDYWKAIQAMCRRADAVVCTTDEQKRDIFEFCKNVHIILDFHNTVIRAVKTDYAVGHVFNFVWEGLPQNISTLQEIRDVFAFLETKRNIALHIITDLEYKQYLGKYGKRRTVDIIGRLFKNAYLYEWNEQLCSTIICACDMALIPLPLNDPFAFGKSPNKLLLFWRMGIPTVVSATPAYTRMMKESGLAMSCRGRQEWQETLEKYMVDESERQNAGKRGRLFVENNYSEEKMLSQWDNLIKSVIQT